MLEIAMALRLKGMAGADGVAEVVGSSAAEVAPVIAEMAAAGHASETPRGFRLTPEGKSWLDGLLEAERAGIDAAAVNDVYDRFCEHNDAFKQLVTDWQVKIVDGEQQLNDHTDEAYDTDIFVRLAALDAEVGPVFADAAALAPRLNRYLDRFSVALAALQAGDHSMLASPMKDSYHTVWFEMHEELILLCGRNRADEAAAGRGA
jgi:pyruvate,orthophosphate dikinase